MRKLFCLCGVSFVVVQVFLSPLPFPVEAAERKNPVVLLPLLAPEMGSESRGDAMEMLKSLFMKYEKDPYLGGSCLRCLPMDLSVKSQVLPLILLGREQPVAVRDVLVDGNKKKKPSKALKTRVKTSGENTNIVKRQVKREQTKGNVKITSQPTQADIIIDGKATGKKTPDVIILEAGTHDLKLKAGGKVFEGKIVVISNRRTLAQIKDFKDIGIADGMTLIKGACFPMGDGFGESDEQPVHEACLGDYYLGDHEVTRGEFSKFVDETGYVTDSEKKGSCYVYGKKWIEKNGADWRAPGFDQEPDHPVVCVSWNDANAYTKWLTKQKDVPYRLPTEAEWEYAARSGGKNEKWSGTSDESLMAGNAWYGGNSGGKTHPVKSKEPNDLGIHDMSGNVVEWVYDRYDPEYYGSSPRNAPEGPPSGPYRVRRGGSWGGDPGHLRTYNRFRSSPDIRENTLGFRLARTY